MLLSQTATFDELGRLLTFVGAASQTWTYGYDKTDNQTSITDPRTNVYSRGFDGLNRLISESNEDHATVTLTRNGTDDVTNYNDPRSLNTTYVRNGFGDVIRRTSPDTGITDYVYSAAAKVTQITDARGIVTTLTYDNAGRLLTKQYPAATAENITVTWDSTASGNHGKGRITRIQDASGSVEWFYDTLGRATQEKKTTASIVYTINYAYDADGNVTQITYPSGRIVSYSRDALGRISGVTTQANATASVVTLATTVSYQPFGPLQSLWFGNGLDVWKTFTSDYLLDVLLVQDTATSTTYINRAHTRTDQVNLTNIWDNVDATRNESYWYTASNMLQNASGQWGSSTYNYDAVGNRTYDIETVGSTTTTNVLNYASTNNLVGSITQGSTTVRSFGYDAMGNVTTDTQGGTVYTYRYNNRARLDQLTIGTTLTASYTYDGLERLAIRTTQNMTPAGTTHYLYDRSGQLLVEANASGNTVREYVWFDDMPLAVVADVDTATPKLWYVHSDHLNRPIKMTDDSKAVVWDAIYRPFGEIVSITGSGSNNLRFPGQYFLIESGLHYNWYRHYDPTIGRYTQPDSSEFVDGPSIYAYARSNPAQNFDPNGRNSIAIGAGTGAAVGGPLGAVAGAIVGVGVAVGGYILWDRYFSDSGRKRGRSDPIQGRQPVDVGRDCNGRCNPCPADESWPADGDAHGSGGGTHHHGIKYDQNPETCICYPRRVSGPSPDKMR